MSPSSLKKPKKTTLHGKEKIVIEQKIGMPENKNTSKQSSIKLAADVAPC